MPPVLLGVAPARSPGTTRRWWVTLVPSGGTSSTEPEDGTMPLRFIAGRILRELIGVLALSMMALPGVAVAQDVAVSLDELLLRSGSLQPGEGVYVTDAAGRRLKGTLSDVSSTGWWVTHRGQAWTVAAADVREIDLQDSLRNGASRTAWWRSQAQSPRCAGPVEVTPANAHTCCCTRFRSWRSAVSWAVLWTLSGTRRSTARPGQCKHPCHRSCRTGVSAHRYRSLGEPTSPRLTRFAAVVSQQRSWESFSPCGLCWCCRASRGAACRRCP